jgi:hypothetical protein
VRRGALLPPRPGALHLPHAGAVEPEAGAIEPAERTTPSRRVSTSRRRA